MGANRKDACIEQWSWSDPGPGARPKEKKKKKKIKTQGGKQGKLEIQPSISSALIQSVEKTGQGRKKKYKAYARWVVLVINCIESSR